KTALSHLVTDHRRAQVGSPRPLPPDVADRADPADDEGEEFLASWRAELLDRTWDGLAAAPPTAHARRLLRGTDPDLTSAELAEQAGAQLGRPLTAAAARKALQRAHAHFAELLVAEVARSLDGPTSVDVEAELRELDLLRYCRSVARTSEPPV